MPYEMEEDDLDELRRDVKFDRAYQRQLNAAPDCRDPDHPGCEECCDSHCE